MKKAIAPIIVSVVGVLIGLLPSFAQWGWTEMFEWLSPQTARLFFWVTLGITIFLSSALAIFQYRERIRLLFPILQIFKTDNITTIRIERKVKGTSGIGYRRDMKRHPYDFIFPFIQEVNISPIINGQNYLLLRVYLVSALPYHFNLDKVRIRLFITELSTREQPITKEQPIIEEEPTTKKPKAKKSIVLNAESNNELSNLRIYLTKKTREAVIKYFQQNKSVEVYLHIIT